MTGILSNQLPGRANPPDANNPLGSFKDRTAPGANDGSYLTQTWANDRNSLLQALFIASGLTPNGVEDTGTASQLFDALVNNRWSSIGNYSVGTVVTATDGNQYYCNQANGRDTTVVDPISDALDFWRQYPYETVDNSDVRYKKWYNGQMTAEGKVIIPNGSNNAVVNFFVPFTSSPSVSYGFDRVGESAFISYSSLSPTSVQLNKSSGSSGNYEVGFTASGNWS